MGRRLSSVAGVVAVCAASVAHAAVARAEATETFCSSGSAAAPWQNGVGGGGSAWGEMTDGCASGGVFGFDNATASLPGGGEWSAGIVAPAGEVFTGVSLTFSTEPRSSGSETFVVLGDGQSILTEYETDDGASHTFSTSQLPQTNSVWLRYDCSTSASTGCNLQNWGDTLAVAAVTLTVFDTIDPSISGDGGSLNTHGATATLGGTQSVGYDATDTASGIAEVTVSLGTTVVGSATSTCRPASLTPCPASASGVISANTTLVPDGTYPVDLTATSAFGGATSVHVGNVTVDNAAATTSVTPGGDSARAIRTRVTFDWDPSGASTRLIWTRFGRLPRGARITLTCTGHGCPFHRLRGTARRIRTLERHLRHRSFRAGDRLALRITAPHRTAESGTEVIRRGRRPVTLAPGRHRHH